MVGNKWRTGVKPWNAGRKGVYSKKTLKILSKLKKGSTHQEDHKQKIKESMKLRWSDPAYKAKHAEAMKKVGERMRGKNNVSKRPDVRAKMSLAASRAEVIDSKARKMPYSNTSIELLMRAELECRGIVFKANHQLFEKYNVDIFIEPNIVVECDGDYWHSLERMKLKDKRRDGALKTKGFVIYRFWGKDIEKDVSACVNQIILP
jgi:very-short-patch-repair endonuclease